MRVTFGTNLITNKHLALLVAFSTYAVLRQDNKEEKRGHEIKSEGRCCLHNKNKGGVEAQKEGNHSCFFPTHRNTYQGTYLYAYKLSMLPIETESLLISHP